MIFAEKQSKDAGTSHGVRQQAAPFGENSNLSAIGKIMRISFLKTGLLLLLAVPLLAAAHFYTPRVDVVRITGINTIRVDTDRDPANNNLPGQTRDVYEIFAESFDKKQAYVYENEDDWRYLKFNSADVQSRANAIATGREDKDRIAAVTHIGWRIPVLSMFPNALNVKAADIAQSTFPVVGAVIWALLAVLIIGAVVMFRRWTGRRRLARETKEAAARAELLRIETTKNDAKDDTLRRFIDNP